MAYEGGGLLQIWKPDLTTRLGTQSAMDSAKFCFLIVAGFRIVVYGVGGVAAGSSLGALPLEGMAVLAAILLLDIGLPLLAASRLHIYQGAFVVPVATVLYVIGILASATIASVVIGAIFTGAFISGIRGVWALRRKAAFEDDHYATFG